MRPPFTLARVDRPPLSRTLLLLTSLVGLGLGAVAFAQTERKPKIKLEQRVKAAFVYRFVKYVEWPEERRPREGKPIVIGVLDDPAVFAALEQATGGKKARGRSIEVVRLKTTDEIESCHVVYVGGAFRPAVTEVVRAAIDASVLTVSDQELFCKRGGMIELFKSAQKVRFRIHLAATRRAKLKLSSKLLRLGELYEDE